MTLSRKARWLAAAVVASVVMSAAVGSAQASRGLSVTNGVTLFTANGTITKLTGDGINERCFLTLGIILNRSIAKATLAQIGVIQLTGTGSSVRACQVTTNWEILNNITIGYLGFTGSLPNITSILARSNNFQIALTFPIIGRCLYTGSLPMAFNRGAAGTIDTITLNAVNSLIAPPPCPSPASINGVLTVLPVKPVIQLI